MQTVFAQSPDLSGMVSMDGAEGVPDFYIDRYEYPNMKGVLPTSGLSLSDAENLCVSQNKRLCTAAEWRQACLGHNKLQYAYGTEPTSGICHQSPVQNSTHTSMMSDGISVPSGTFPDCRSTEGVVDMIGNLEEWVLDDWKGMGGMLEGGASYTHEAYADCTGRYSRMPDYRLTTDQKIVSAGARCCWSEVPLTDSLIALDRTRRLAQKGQESETLTYDATNEVQLPHGGWMDRFEYPNRQGAMAKTGVTWKEAQSLCRTAGKRLCGVYEWESACSGDGEAFSMGGSYIKGACALELREPQPSGTMKGCQNQYGLHDMSGGVWEWTTNGFDAPLLSVGLPDEMVGLAEIRGGSWMVEAQKGLCRPIDGYPVTSKNMAYEDLGFRCCRGEEWVEQHLAWGDQNNSACPQNMVAIGDFCIDRMEYPNQPNTLPQGAMTFETATTLCQQAGKRLCTEAEWTLACEGPEWKGYPYGSTYRSNICATKDVALGGRISESGSHMNCTTPDGILDMTGNVWEWVMDDGGTQGVLRGGGTMLSAGLGRCRSRAQIRSGEPTSFDVGTRCCASLSE